MSPTRDVSPERPRQRLLLVAVATLGIAAVVAVALTWPGTRTRVDVGAGHPGGRATAFELPDVRDPTRMISLADFGGRHVVLNFWASWCNPCRREMPAFQSVHEELGSQFAIVGIDTKDIRRDARAFLRRTGVTYAAPFDPDGDVADEYGVVGFPQTIFIDKHGRIVDRFIGEITREQLVATIEARFGIAA